MKGCAGIFFSLCGRCIEGHRGGVRKMGVGGSDPVRNYVIVVVVVVVVGGVVDRF